MAKQLLNDTQAAKHLGITKELLYAYIKNAPKIQLGHDRKLLTVIKDGNNYFDFDELAAFDAYLKEPWSKPGEKRPPIPKYVEDYLRAEIRGQCPITGKGAPLDNAHIVDYAQSLSHHHHNLIRIAKDEHTKADSGILPKSILVAHKQQLVDRLRKELTAKDNSYLHTLKPPLPHPFFVGRDIELFGLIRSMETERLVVIQGIGGIGKTQLLLNALQQVCFHNPVVYVNIETVTDPKELIILLQNALFEVTGKQSTRSFIEDIKELTITFVFDSLEKLLIPYRDEVEDFITDLLRTTDSLQLLITSQVDLSIFDHQQCTVQLSGIDNGSLLMILQDTLPEHIPLSQNEVNWILEFCNGHPLSLKLAASLIIFLGSAEKAIVRIEAQDNLEQPLRRVHNKSTSLTRCLSTVFDCLTKDEKAFLFFVRCNPAGLDIRRYSTKHEDQDIDRLVASIKQFFLIDIYQDDFGFERVAIPNPIRPFITSMAKKFDGDIEAIEYEAYGQTMIEAMIFDTYYIEGWRDGPPEIGIRKLDQELPNILEAFHAAEGKIKTLEKPLGEKEKRYVAMVTGISSALGKFCFTRGYFDYGIMFARAGIRSNLLLDDFDLVAQQYMYLAQIFERQFDLDNFEKTIVEMDNISRQTDSLEMQINTNWAKGRFAIETKDWSNAKNYLISALNLLGKKKNPSAIKDNESDITDFYIDELAVPGNKALILSELGKVYEFSGDLDQAIIYYNKAIKVQEQCNDETNLLSSYHHLGYCLIHTGKIDEGLKLLLLTVEGFHRNRQYEYLGNSMSEIGRVLYERSELLDNPLLNEERIEVALENICEQITGVYSRLITSMNSEQAIAAIPSPLKGKLLYLTMLISSTSFRDLLWRFMAQLYELFKADSSNNDYLILIIGLGHITGGVDEWRTGAECERVMKQLCLYCIMLNGGPDINGKTKIFQWFAFWMNTVGLRQGVTPEEMWEDALSITKIGNFVKKASN